MKQHIKFMAFLFAALMVLSSNQAFAKKDGDPSGWGKGEKKGWHDEKMPPGLSKKDADKAKGEAKKAEKAAKKEAKKAEKEAKKKQKEAEREAKKKQHEAEEAAEKAKEQAEKANS